MSNRKTHDAFIQEMAQKMPQINVIGKYINTHTKIACQCRKCGCEWNARPHDLLAGHGCPSCSYVIRGNARKKTAEVFKSEMSTLHPELALKSEYISNHFKVQVECLICGFIWNTSPHSLLSGSGCPQCAKKTMGQPRISQSEFISRLSESFPKIQMIGPYNGFSSVTLFKCRDCGKDRKSVV